MSKKNKKKDTPQKGSKVTDQNKIDTPISDSNTDTNMKKDENHLKEDPLSPDKENREGEIGQPDTTPLDDNGGKETDGTTGVEQTGKPSFFQKLRLKLARALAKKYQSGTKQPIDDNGGEETDGTTGVEQTGKPSFFQKLRFKFARLVAKKHLEELDNKVKELEEKVNEQTIEIERLNKVKEDSDTKLREKLEENGVLTERNDKLQNENNTLKEKQNGQTESTKPSGNISEQYLQKVITKLKGVIDIKSESLDGAISEICDVIKRKCEECDDKESQITGLKREKRELNKKVAEEKEEAEKKLNGKQAELDKIKSSEKGKLKQEIEDYKKDINNKENTITSLRNDITELNDKNNELENEKNRIGSQLKQCKAKKEKIEKDLKGEIEKLKISHKGEISELRTENDTKIEELKIRHENEINNINSNHKKEIDNVKSEKNVLEGNMMSEYLSMRKLAESSAEKLFETLKTNDVIGYCSDDYADKAEEKNQELLVASKKLKNAISDLPECKVASEWKKKLSEYIQGLFEDNSSIICRLLKYYAMSNVPCMIDKERETGLYFIKKNMSAAYDCLAILLAQCNITPVIPAIFVENINEGDFDVEGSFNDIESFCPGSMKEHIEKIERGTEGLAGIIVGVTKVGYKSADGSIVVKPQVIIK